MPNFASTNAPVAKLVDAPDLGSGDFGRVGSSPIRRTLIQQTRPLIGGLVYFYTYATLYIASDAMAVAFVCL